MPGRVLHRQWLWLGVLLGASAARADDSHLRYLPSDTKMVLTIHAAALGDEEKKNGLELIRQLYFDRLLPELDPNEKLPISDVIRVVLAWPSAGTLASVLVVRGKIDRKLLETQCRTSKRLTVEALGKPAAPVFHRKLDDGIWTELFPQLGAVPASLRKVVAPQDVYLAALDDETLFVSLAGKPQMVRALRARSATTAPRTTEELTKLLTGQNPKDVAAFVLLDDALSPPLQLVASEAVKETFDQFAHVTARVRGGAEIEVVLQIEGKSSDLARELADKSEQSLKVLRANLDKLVPNPERRAVAESLLRAFHVTRKDAVVTLSARLPEADARKLLPVTSQKKEGAPGAAVPPTPGIPPPGD